MIVVVDANIALALAVNLSYSAPARSAVARAMRILAPDLVVAEVCNGLWRLVSAGHVAAERCDTLFNGTMELFDALEPSGPLAAAAMRDAITLKHPVYDLFYVALARERDATLLTADRKLARHARTLGVPVMEISETGVF
jgi:predicted nucleic acid-binding protein